MMTFFTWFKTWLSICLCRDGHGDGFGDATNDVGPLGVRPMLIGSKAVC